MAERCRNRPCESDAARLPRGRRDGACDRARGAAVCLSAVSRRRLLGTSNALAAGVMLGASASLIIEGADRSVPRVIVGLAAGAAFVLAMQQLFSRIGTPEVGQLVGADARKAALIIAVMTAHSAAEGVGVGASFGGGDALGLAITIAIALHNIPEGVTISLVMVPRGATVLVRRSGASSQASPTAPGGSGLPLRGAVHRDPPGRTRIRRRCDGLDGLAGTPPRGDPARPKPPISDQPGRPGVRRHARLPNLAPRLAQTDAIGRPRQVIHDKRRMHLGFDMGRQKPALQQPLGLHCVLFGAIHMRTHLRSRHESPPPCQHATTTEPRTHQGGRGSGARRIREFDLRLPSEPWPCDAGPSASASDSRGSCTDLRQRPLTWVDLLLGAEEVDSRALKLHKRLHTYRTLGQEQVVLNGKAPTCGAFAEPSDGLEPSTPSLPCAPTRLPWVATGCGSACLGGFRGRPVCHRLPPVAPAGLHTCSISRCSDRVARWSWLG